MVNSTDMRAQPRRNLSLRRGRAHSVWERPITGDGNSVIKSFVGDFLKHTTLHGLSYLVMPNFTKFERLFWGTCFLLSLAGIAYTSFETWNRYGGTVTYIETTRYSLSEVPFPSVSICDATMVDWQRALLLNQSDLPPPFETSKEEALNLLKRLGYVGFGDFDFLDQLRLSKTTLDTLKSVNITDLLLKVRRPCEEMFTGFCWWKDKEFDCCTLFELQKTDRGFCWSFNSDTSEDSKELSLDEWHGRWTDQQGVTRPRKSVARGPWSGLRVELTPMKEESLPPDRNITNTFILVIVNDPRAFPQGTYVTVPNGVLGNLAVWGDSIYTRPEVKTLPLDERDCLFPEEDYGQKFRKEYNKDNCIYQCYREYILKYCGCVPDFIFLDSLKRDGVVPCNVDGLMCLSYYNDQLNFLKPSTKSQQDDDEEGMVCDCPKDCNSHEYITELFSPFNTGNDSNIILDVYFRLSYCVLYETGITNDWLTTIVSFGGIAGLFLGASLLSFAELIYFLTIRLYCIWRKKKKVRAKIGKMIAKQKSKIAYYE